jgi:hypothetical protein
MSYAARSAHDASRMPRSFARSFAFKALVCGAAILLHALPLRARAQANAGQHTYALNWVRGPGAEACISSSELAERVEQLLGPVFRAPDGASRAIEGLIAKAPSGAGFQVQLQIVDRSGVMVGERAFSSAAASCEAASAPALLVVALMIDPSASERGLPPDLLGLLDPGATPGSDLLADLERERAERALASAEGPRPSSSSERAPSEPAPSEPAPRATESAVEEHERAPERGRGPDPNERPLALELTLGPLLGFEMQPNVALGVAVGIRVVTSGIAFELGLNHWLASEIASTDPSSGRRVLTDLEASGASLRACFDAMRDDDVAVTPCAGAALLVRSFESSALGNADERPRTSFGPLASLDVRYAVFGPWFALAGAGAVLLVPRDTFYYIDWVGQAQVFYEPSLIGFWGELGFGVRL